MAYPSQVCHLPVAPSTRCCRIASGCVSDYLLKRFGWPLSFGLPLVSSLYKIFLGSLDEGKTNNVARPKGCSMIMKDSMLVTLASSKTLLLVRLSCHSMSRQCIYIQGWHYYDLTYVHLGVSLDVPVIKDPGT